MLTFVIVVMVLYVVVTLLTRNPETSIKLGKCFLGFFKK